MCIVWVKKSVDCTCDTIYLAESTDTEQTDTDTEEREQLSKPGPFFSHALLDIIERTAKAVTVRCDDAVLDSEKSLGIFGCHAKEGSYDHPEQGTGTAGTDCGCNTDDISGTDRCT